MNFVEFRCSNQRCQKLRRISESEFRARKASHDRYHLSRNYYCSNACFAGARQALRSASPTRTPPERPRSPLNGDSNE